MKLCMQDKSLLITFLEFFVCPLKTPESLSNFDETLNSIISETQREDFNITPENISIESIDVSAEIVVNVDVNADADNNVDADVDVDIDGDGQINYEEFYLMMTSTGK